MIFGNITQSHTSGNIQTQLGGFNPKIMVWTLNSSQDDQKLLKSLIDAGAVAPAETVKWE